MSATDVLAELRRSTRAEHDRIEQLLALDERMPLARYAAVMAGFDAFLRAWEPRILAALPERLQDWYRPRRRGELASADLQWLRANVGVEPPPLRADAAQRLPLRDMPEVLGSLYVIEGSALGGRVIAPRLERALGVVAGRGASYFNGFGAETGAMWHAFRTLAVLEMGDSAHATALACRSARRTFAALVDLFAPLEHGDGFDATRPLPLHGEESDTLVELPLDALPPAAGPLR